MEADSSGPAQQAVDETIPQPEQPAKGPDDNNEEAKRIDDQLKEAGSLTENVYILFCSY